MNNKQQSSRLQVMHFSQLSRKGYAIFRSLRCEVLIGVLSVATLVHAKADGVSTDAAVAADTLSRHEKQLDEVVVTGSRAPLTMAERSVIVAVVSRDDIDRAAAATVNDVLKMACGVDVRQRGAFGVQTDISIDGGTFDQIVILLNGFDISNPATGHNAADFPVSVSDIERVEVLSGAASRRIGSGALCGAVNIVTRQEGRNSLSAGMDVGQFATVGVHTSATLCGHGMSHRLSHNQQRSNGAVENSDFKRRQLFYSGTYGSHALRMQWQAGDNLTDFGANTFYSAKFRNQFESLHRTYAAAAASWQPFSIDFTIKPRLSWHRDRDHYQLIREKTGAENGENYHLSDIYDMGLDLALQWGGGLSTVGAEWRRDDIRSTALGKLQPEDKWKDIKGSERMYSRRARRNDLSAFINHTFSYRAFILSAGMQASRHTLLNTTTNVSPGADVSLRLTDRWSAHASWNKSMRLPTFTDLYISNAVQQGDPSLKAERMDMWRLSSRYVSPALAATATLFLANGSDMIDWVFPTAESTQYKAMNLGRINKKGVSLDGTLYINNVWRKSPLQIFKLSYQYIDQKHNSSFVAYKSLYVLDHLRHKLTASLTHRVARNVDAQWTLRYQQRVGDYDPYAKLDLKLRYSRSAFSAYLQAENLTNTHYVDIGGVPQPGLWIMGGVAISL